MRNAHLLTRNLGGRSLIETFYSMSISELKIIPDCAQWPSKTGRKADCKSIFASVKIKLANQ